MLGEDLHLSGGVSSLSGPGTGRNRDGTSFAFHYLPTASVQDSLGDSLHLLHADVQGFCHLILRHGDELGVLSQGVETTVPQSLKSEAKSFTVRIHTLLHYLIHFECRSLLHR